ncbi:Atp-binding protein, partial [Globisporangium splendens]
MGSPDGAPSTLQTEPAPPFAAVSSLTTINIHHLDDKSSNSRMSTVTAASTASASMSRCKEKSRMMQQRKRLKTRFSDMARSRNWKMCQKGLFLLGVIGVGLLASFMIFRFIRTDEFNSVIEWIQTHEAVGSFVYVLAFTTFIILCFPSTAFELLAGYIFGFWLGLLLATIGKLLGSVLSFLIGRYLCRKRVRAYMERGHPVFKAFQSLLRKRQVLIVFLTRIAFFPIAIKNYGLSVLEVKFAVYCAAALLTGLPFSIIWVYSGHAAQHLTMLLSSHDSASKQTEIIVLIIGAASALSLLVFIGVYTRKHILALAEEETVAASSAESAAHVYGTSIEEA